MDLDQIARGVRLILEGIGEDPDRPGLKRTPARVAEMFQQLFSGLENQPPLEVSTFKMGKHDDLVLIRDIRFYSTCEHHLVPFMGKAHIAYIPSRCVVTGLSSLVKVLEHYARQPQVQERLTKQVADSLMSLLKPLGVMVVIEAEHLCLSMRGVQKPGTITITSAVRGVFRKHHPARAEVLSLIGKEV